MLVAMLKFGSVSRSIRLLLWCVGILVALVFVYAVAFHALMYWEGQRHSWISGIYWVLVTMSTLGYGDITFHDDVGRLFTGFVAISGVVMLLIMLQFSFLEFWKAQIATHVPRSVPQSMRGHVIITHYDTVTTALIRQLDKTGVPSVVVVSDAKVALDLQDGGVRVVVADLAEPEGFERCGFDRAVMVAATGNDFENTSVVFTARQMSKSMTIVATAESNDSVEILQLAGATRVVQLGEQLGSALARRTIASDAQAHVIGNFDRLLIAEAMVAGTPLQGKTLAQARLRELSGVTVVGFWKRGAFTTPTADALMTADTMLVLAGTEEQMATYNELFFIYRRIPAPCIIIGAGRVGCAVEKAFAATEIDYRIVEKNPVHLKDPELGIVGSASDLAVLKKAGIDNAPAVLITTRQDDLNIYLTIYCRKLRPDIQIIVRANNESNVDRFHAAGADVVLSYASMGSNMIHNLLRYDETLLVAEGLGIFRVPVPQSLVRKTIRECDIRARTGCSIIALEVGKDLILNPHPDEIFRTGQEILLIGNMDDEEKFINIFAEK